MRTLPPAPLPVVTDAKALAADPLKVEGILARWFQRFSAVLDRAQRRTVLREIVLTTDDATLLATLQRLEVRATAGSAPERWLTTELALSPSVLLDLDADRRDELVAAAVALDWEPIGLRFIDDSAPPPATRDDNPHLDRSAGERIASARGARRTLLDRLLHDRDIRVITALLDNPRIVEADVVRIAAQRPTQPEILTRIVEHPRWGVRYRVRKTVAFNPSTPTPLARQLLPTLLLQDLRTLGDSVVMPPLLRDLIKQTLESRSPPHR